MEHHTGLLQQFLKQVLAKIQQFIHLKPAAAVLTPEQFCVVLQASREVARLLEGGATVEDILNSSFAIAQGTSADSSGSSAPPAAAAAAVGGGSVVRGGSDGGGGALRQRTTAGNKK
jgi:hypothetical protein